MSDIESRLDRIEQLLLEGNRLSQQAIDLQKSERQASLIEEQGRNITKAAQINEMALALQIRSRRVITLAFIGVLLALAALIFIVFFHS